MSTASLATVPGLRRLPVPVAEPRPALRIVPESTPAPVTRVASPRPEAPFSPDRGGGPGDAPQPVPPPAAAWTRQFVQTALEAAAGRRPVSQLLRWSNEEVYSLLTRRAALAARLDRTGGALHCSVRSVHLHPLRAGVVEACAVVSDRGRFRAVALRLEDGRGRWRVTALEIG